MISIKKKAPEKPASPERPLPEPDPMTSSLTKVFMNRKSSLNFSDEPIADMDLARILWAADGINSRKKGNDHRTTPTTFNWREIDIYVVKANGVWLWVPERNVLSFVSPQDKRADLCLLQPMVRQAPVHLVYVYNREKTQGTATEVVMKIVHYLNRKNISKLSEEVMQKAPLLDTGAKVMAVYMAASALNINCLARLTFDSEKVHKTLKLSADQTPLCVQTLGYKHKSCLQDFLSSSTKGMGIFTGP